MGKPPYGFDTSAFINGSRDHFFPEMVPSAWRLIEDAIDDGRIVVVRAVLLELEERDDEMTKLVQRHADAVVEPNEAVQRRAGEIGGEFPQHHRRHRADPFILAEAEASSLTVVTYEGVTFAGIEKTKGWAKSMPGVCAKFGIECCTLPQALQGLGWKAP